MRRAVGGRNPSIGHIGAIVHGCASLGEEFVGSGEVPILIDLHRLFNRQELPSPVLRDYCDGPLNSCDPHVWPDKDMVVGLGSLQRWVDVDHDHDGTRHSRDCQHHGTLFRKMNEKEGTVAF